MISWAMLMRAFEFGLCALLALLDLGHLRGTFLFYTTGTEVFVWSLSASAIVFAFLFALAEGNPTDPRALMHIVISAGLAITAFRQRSIYAQGVS